MLGLLIAAVFSIPSYFLPPFGWMAKEPPDDANKMGMVAIWSPPKLTGSNIMLLVHARRYGETLADSEKELIREETGDGRTLESVHPHATCEKRQPGVDVDMQFAMTSQLYHLAVKGGRVYALVHTRASGEPVGAEILHSIDSLCPHDFSAANLK